MATAPPPPSNPVRPKRKVRPRLQPIAISPDKLSTSFGSDDEYGGLGFGDIVTMASTTPKEEDEGGADSNLPVDEGAGPPLAPPAPASSTTDASTGDAGASEEEEGETQHHHFTAKGSGGEMAHYSTLASTSAAVAMQALCLDGLAEACCGGADEASVSPEPPVESPVEAKGTVPCGEWNGTKGGGDVSASFALAPLHEEEGADEASPRHKDEARDDIREEMAAEPSVVVSEDSSAASAEGVALEPAVEHGGRELDTGGVASLDVSVVGPNEPGEAVGHPSDDEGNKDNDDNSDPPMTVPAKYDDCTWKELPADAKEAAQRLGYTEGMWDADDEPAGGDVDWDDLDEDRRRAAGVLGYDQEAWDMEDAEDSTIDDLSSVASSSSSSSSESESENEVMGSQVADSRTNPALRRLQAEIRTRQRQMAKLLRGREGTAYADMMQRQEAVVNAHLLGRHGTPDKPSVPLSEAANKVKEAPRGAVGNGSPPTTDEAAAAARPENVHAFHRPFRTVRSVILDECFHTLPGAASLVLHCALYVTIYASVSKFVSWLCEATVIGLTGWHVTENNFDSTFHENAFYLALLGLSLVAARVTGVVYDWNENRRYHKRLEFAFRNKWHARTWDARVLDFFLGGELRDEYEEENSGGKRRPRAVRGKRWGPRLKHLLDLLSFFVCYKCVDSFVYNLGALPLSDITDAVVEGLPSRHLQAHRDLHLKENGRSYACQNVMSALDNPYALDMLEWIAEMNVKSDEAKGWIRNAKECGWYGLDGDEEGDAEGSGDSDDSDDDSSDDSDDAAEHPAFLRQKQVMSALDDEYLRKIISDEDYYDLVGEPNPRFYDPSREVLFLLATTAACFGLLSYLDVPFLLI